MRESGLIAAIDLGSNSFRLQVARLRRGRPQPVDTHKEAVRLGAGLDAEGNLTPQAQADALAALARFGERLRRFAPGRVRAVATNTFRVARNARDFLPEAEAALGCRIEVIGGAEEARLIYLGAAHSLPPTREKRLIVDIGGGSTELVVGRQFRALLTESTPMGCVSWSRRFFEDGVIDAPRLERAQLAARAALEPLREAVAAAGWRSVIGTSGTARSLADVLEQSGLSTSGITAGSLARLREILLRAGHVDAVRLHGLRDDRRPVLAGGFAIMAAVFEALQLTHMTITHGALRDGVMYDLVRRLAQADVRDATVSTFVRRHHADAALGLRAAGLAGELFGQLPHAASDLQRTLQDAARLHGIGRAISRCNFHLHSAYLLRHADMPGYSLPEQERLATLVGAQQGALPLQMHDEAEWQALLALRLALLFCRETIIPPLRLQPAGQGHVLSLPKDWLRQHPLTGYVLEEEAHAWQASGRPLIVQPD